MTFGVQTFTIRKEQKNDIKKAYLPLIELGIKEFEVARINFNQQNAKIIQSLVEEYGIRVVAIQVKPKYAFGNVKEMVEFCEMTGCKTVVISMLPFHCILGSEKVFYEFLDTLDQQYEQYKDCGIELAYHHHDWEYIRLSNGKTRMDELLEKTKKIKFVHDTYWSTKSGVPSEVQIQRFGKRLKGIHLRDFSTHKNGLKVLSKDAAIGEGVIDFEKVFTEANKVGCDYYVIEQKTEVPYEKIRISYQNCIKICSAYEVK